MRCRSADLGSVANKRGALKLLRRRLTACQLDNQKPVTPNNFCFRYLTLPCRLYKFCSNRKTAAVLTFDTTLRHSVLFVIFVR